MADKVEQEVIVRISTDESGIGSGVADLNKDIAKSGEATKSFKAQLKEAREAALALAQAGKENSKEYQNAVRTIAELRDQQDVLNRSITAMDAGNKFQALSKVAGLGASAIGGLTGTMTLLGISSDTANESIAKLQSIQAIIALTDTWGDSVDFLKPFLIRLGLVKVAQTEVIAVTEAQTVATTQATVATTGLSTAFKLLGIGLIVSTIVALIVYFKEIKEAVLEFIPGIKSLGLAFDFVKTAVTDFVGITSNATRELDKLTKAVTKNNEAIDNQVAKLSAAGGKEDEIYKLKQKRVENDLNVLRKKLQVEGKLTDEELKTFKKLKLDKELEDIKETKRLNDKSKAAQDKIDAANKTASDKAKQVADAKRIKLKTDSEAELKTITDNLKVSQKLLDDSKRTELEKSENDIKLKYQTEIDLASKHHQDTLVIEAARDLELATARKKSSDEKSKQAKELAAEAKKKADENFQALQDANLLDVENDNRPNDTDSPDVAKNKILAIEAAKVEALNETFEYKKAQLIGQKEQLRLLEEQHEKDLTDVKDENVKAREVLDKKEAESKLKMLDAVGAGASAVGDLIGKETVAGKMLAVAASTINTYSAIAGQLAAFSKVPVPGYAIAQAIATGVAGLAAVRNIIKVQVPSKSGGGSTSGAAPSFTASTAPVINSTILNDRGVQDVRVNGNVSTTTDKPIKAYVVEKDLDSKKRQDAFIERTSNI
jgi:flagellar biosynthesis protein FliQ